MVSSSKLAASIDHWLTENSPLHPYVVRGSEWLVTSSSIKPWIQLIKRIGMGKIALFILLTQPTNGRHWMYYGWIARVVMLFSIGFAAALFRANNPKTAAVLLLAFTAYRLYQRHQALKERHKLGIKVNTVEELRERVERDLPYPIEKHEFTTRDNVRLAYQTVGKGDELVMLANGIGGTIWHFDPFLNLLAQRHMYEKFTVVSWDYRGLFGSSTPKHTAAASMRDHAEDVRELANHLGHDTIHTIIGWSTGAQVALELVTMYPERVGRMVILNGSHGRTLQSAFQPLFRVPWGGDCIHDLINFVRHNMTSYYKSIANFMITHQKWMYRLLRPYGLIYNQLDAEKFLGFYCIDILHTSTKHTHAYLMSLQFLDAHSAEHLLADIKTPTLIITAMLDYLTPAYQSFEMHRQIPNSKLICHNLATHFALLEKPEKIGREIADFVCDDEGIEYSPHYERFVRHEPINRDNDTNDLLIKPGEENSKSTPKGDTAPEANREGAGREARQQTKSRRSSIDKSDTSPRTQQHYDVLDLHRQQSLTPTPPSSASERSQHSKSHGNMGLLRHQTEQSADADISAGQHQVNSDYTSVIASPSSGTAELVRTPTSQHEPSNQSQTLVQ